MRKCDFADKLTQGLAAFGEMWYNILSGEKRTESRYSAYIAISQGKRGK